MIKMELAKTVRDMIGDSGRPGLSPQAPASGSANGRARRVEGEEARRDPQGR